MKPTLVFLGSNQHCAYCWSKDLQKPKDPLLPCHICHLLRLINIASFYSEQLTTHWGAELSKLGFLPALREEFRKEVTNIPTSKRETFSSTEPLEREKGALRKSCKFNSLVTLSLKNICIKNGSMRRPKL